MNAPWRLSNVCPLLNGRAAAVASPAAKRRIRSARRLYRGSARRRAASQRNVRAHRQLVKACPLGPARPGSASLGRPRARHGPWRAARCPASSPQFGCWESLGRDFRTEEENRYRDATTKATVFGLLLNKN